MNLTIFWFGSCSCGFPCFFISFFQFLFFSFCSFPGNQSYIVLFLFLFFWFPAKRAEPINSPPCVRTSVRHTEISESVHRNFLKFGTKLGLPNATEVTFSDFARKIPFGPFWPFLGPKMAFLAQKWTFRPFSRKLVIGSS